MASHPKEGDKLVKAYHKVHNGPVPMSQSTEQLMLKLSAPLTDKGDTASLDVVFVLDTSGSMRGDKLKDMKHALNNFIFNKLGAAEKLGGGDGLAIIPFSSTAPALAETDKWYSARSLTPGAKQKAAEFVEKLEASGNTNIEAGLRAALDYLDKGRIGTKRNASCIFLMSDGHENVGKASNLYDAVADHSVVTFGFGENSDEKLLYGIASNSHVGTYQHVREKEDQNKLMTAYAAQLGIYRSISMLGVKVTLRPQAGCKIVRVDPGRYKKGRATNLGYVRINFGDLARHENRRILVDLQLPKVEQEQKDVIVMDVEYEYSAPKIKASKKDPASKKDIIHIKMNRVRNPPVQAMDPNVRRELVRRDQVVHLYKVMSLADEKKMEDAQEVVADAMDDLRRVQHEKEKDEAVDALANELDNLEEFVDNYDDYHKLGRAYLLACISSHERQRFASRGGLVPVDLFRTPRMVKYLAEARKAHKNHRKP